MGRHAEFTEEQIVEAGLELEGKVGKGKITISGIRQALGGGSAVRIKEIWNSFLLSRDEKEASQNHQADIDLPLELEALFEKHSSTVLKLLKQFVNESYRLSDNLSELKVKGRLEEYSEQIEIFQREEAALLVDVDKAREETFDLNSQNEVLESEITELKSQNAELKGQLKVFQETIAKHDEKAQHYEKVIHENGRLEQIISEYNGSLNS